METNVYWLWLLSMGSLIFLMQAGFFLLEGGQVRSRDVANVMMKMTGHMGVGIIVFLLFGFAIKQYGWPLAALPNIGLVNRIPLWLTILIISRDVGIVLTVAIVNLAVGPRTFKPSPLGKAATAIFIVACVVVMLFNYLGYHSRWVDAAIWTTFLITLASGVDYVRRIAMIINRS